MATAAVFGTVSLAALTLPPATENSNRPIAIEDSEVVEASRSIASRELIIDGAAPPAPGGGIAASPSLDRSAAAANSVANTRVFCDRASATILGAVIERSFGGVLELASRRNVIEHCITGEAGVGIVSVEPSVEERRLGARDIMLGAFRPILIVDRSSPYRLLTRKDAQALLSGRAEFWPGSRDEAKVAGPGAGHRLNLLSEMLIPGDLIKVSKPCETSDDVLQHVRGNPRWIGVINATELPSDDQVVELAIEGFRPQLTLRMVFRNEYDVECGALMSFWRSTDGRQRFDDVLSTR